jgi:FAD/FMN-containing dehydrogenase
MTFPRSTAKLAIEPAKQVAATYRGFDVYPADLLNALSEIVGDDAILSGNAAESYCKDWRGRYSGASLAVVLPSSTREVSEVVALCAANNVAIVPQGGNTSLCGGSVPLPQGNQVLLNLSRMNRIRSTDAINYTMTVEAGCRLADVRAAAERCDRFFPLGLTATQKVCEIGGNLSTNAGGINVLRYGNARDLVLGLEVVLPDGRVWNGLRSLRKDNSGYDLKQLFMGAEGTLGIITAAVLKLYPLPKSTATACVAVENVQAGVRLLAHIRATAGDTLSSFEIMSRSCLDLVLRHIEATSEPFVRQYPYYLLVQLSDVMPVSLDTVLEGALRSFGAEALEYLVTPDAERAESWWKLRKNISEAQKSEGISVKHDISVPVSRVADFIERADAALQRAFPGVRIVAFGHMGDGNVHYNASMPDADQNGSFISNHEKSVNKLVYSVVHELNGSISAEHGLGQLKREVIRNYKDPLELEMMLRIKRALDPQCVMNPGKVL